MMAALVFYGGAGINIIFYCCNQCRSEGIEALLKKDKCCEIPQADKHAPHSCCAKTEQTDPDPEGCGIHCTDQTSDNCCHIEHIRFDWSTQNTAELNIDLSPLTFLLRSEILDISTINFFAGETGAVMPKGPPPACPRDYLSRLTILLI